MQAEDCRAALERIRWPHGPVCPHCNASGRAIIALSVEKQSSATHEIACNVRNVAQGTQEMASNITEVNRGASSTGSASNEVLNSAGALSVDSKRLRKELDAFMGNFRAA